ncbi:MAG: hypothetical protein LBT14_05960 [Treponema sp.]|jgi:hypothetical protein|nr:hypothetical protein [Treponema sp.]
MCFAQQSGTRSRNGSDYNEASRYNELLRVLKERQIPFEERSLFAEYGGFGSSLHVVIPAATPVVGTFVLAIPLSGSEIGEPVAPGRDPSASPFPGSTLSFGFETGLAFIEKIRAQGSSLNIRVAFLGDERSRLPEDTRKRSHSGLADLCATLDSPENTVLWYVDMVYAPEKIHIHHGAAHTITALNVLQPLPALWDSHNIPCSFAVPYNGFYLSGLVHGPEVIRFTHGREINALYLTGSGIGLHPEDDGAGVPVPAAFSGADFADLLIAYTDALTISTENLDYHYSIIDFRGKYRFISETLTVMVLLLIMGSLFFAVLSYSAFHRRMLIIRWRIFFRCSWVLVVFFGMFVITLEIAGFLISLGVKEFNRLPNSGSFYRALFKLVIALVLFYLFAPVADAIKIPGKAHFYSNGAVILVTLGTFSAALLNITFIPLFIGIFLFIFLGSILRIPAVVYLCALLSCMVALYPLFVIIATGDKQLAEIILSDNVWISFYIAVIVLPLILIIKRGTSLFRRRKKMAPLFLRILPPLVCLTMTMGAWGFYAHGVSKIFFIEPVRRTMVESPEIVTIKSATSTFLERRSIEISIEARGSPVRFDMYLDTDDETPQSIYSAPMPFELKHEGNPVEFILGEGPPNPFTTEIVLPLEFSGSLRVEALYPAWDPGVDTLPPPETDDYVLRVIKTIPIKPLSKSGKQR